MRHAIRILRDLRAFCTFLPRISPTSAPHLTSYRRRAQLPPGGSTPTL